MIMPKKRQPMWDLEPYEKEISVICRDFDRFCGYAHPVYPFLAFRNTGGRK